jgi:FixJ family two-component response regulator
MSKSEPIVFIVDDDEAVQQSLSMLVETVGLKSQTYSRAEDFLDAYDPAQAGCLLLDVRMPEMSGLELQSKLAAEGIKIPIIIITGHGDVPMAVQAVKAGAMDFIEKPFRDQVLLDNIQKAIELDAQNRRKQSERTDVEAKIALLTPREREVMNLLVLGKSNKVIAYELGISQKTVDFHRAHTLEKMGVGSVVELVRLTQRAGLTQ